MNFRSGIKSIKDPFGAEVTYASGRTGRMTAIGAASGFGSLTSFATNISHRAFGGVKSMSYSTTAATNITVGWDKPVKTLDFQGRVKREYE